MNTYKIKCQYCSNVTIRRNFIKRATCYTCIKGGMLQRSNEQVDFSKLSDLREELAELDLKRRLVSGKIALLEEKIKRDMGVILLVNKTK